MVFGAPKKFYKKFKFVVEIDGIASAAFQKAGPLSVEVGEVKYREGGALVAQKDPALVEFEDITLERGATDDKEMWDWFKEVADAAANTGMVEPDFKRTLDLVQQDRDGTSLARFRIFDAWPKKFMAGEWDNDAEENVIEQVVLSIQYWDRQL